MVHTNEETHSKRVTQPPRKRNKSRFARKANVLTAMMLQPLVLGMIGFVCLTSVLPILKRMYT